jgi:tetratricopeptide (TPR) repeat protein
MPVGLEACVGITQSIMLNSIKWQRPRKKVILTHRRLIIILGVFALVIVNTAILGQGQDNVVYVTWHEPNEDAFSIEVPQGWTVEGGLYRNPANPLIDIRPYVRATSIDGNIIVTRWDYRFKILFYTKQLSGVECAEWYLSNYPEAGISEITITSRTPANNNSGMINYSCYKNNLPMSGAVAALTTSIGTSWYLEDLATYLAPVSLENLAKTVCSHMMQTSKWNPQWNSSNTQKLNEFNNALKWRANGATLLKQNKSDQALDAFNKAIEMDPSSAIAWRGKGIALAILLRYDEAINAYNNAIELEPNDAPTWASKGTALLMLGRLNDALESLNQSLVLDNGKNNSIAWNFKGEALLQLGNFDEAAKAYNESLELNPDDYFAWMGRNLALSSLQDSAGAMTDLNKSTRLNNNDSYFKKWDAFIGEGGGGDHLQ